MRKLRIHESRKRAVELLQTISVAEPDEIDLDLLAWRAGRFRIVDGSLTNALGRLVRGADGGTIRVSADIRHNGRRRFTIAHEIGHGVLHAPGTPWDGPRELATWGDSSIEAEANGFAAELLMPVYLFEPRIVGCRPEHSIIDALADEFGTSNLASARQFIDCTQEPAALVVCTQNGDGWKCWHQRSASFTHRLRGSRPHPHTAAGEIIDGKGDSTGGLEEIPADAWLENVARDTRSCILEDSRSIPALKMIVTLLWVDDEIAEEWGED
ncbi:MAG: ImmA/IrrE family metallo-endopeptidase [Lentisphaerae bacterium]|jgi:hypothetical protein|nr:ImmA/IrrE family metallo-endopeptidase [Lentisphaerota bacterium]MBT5608611.1 ImmA/IrrE family metallo-endopeptidase [Lentisphaerota bacterium]